MFGRYGQTSIVAGILIVTTDISSRMFAGHREFRSQFRADFPSKRSQLALRYWRIGFEWRRDTQITKFPQHARIAGGR
jgi:hypothetical protein